MAMDFQPYLPLIYVAIILGAIYVMVPPSIWSSVGGAASYLGNRSTKLKVDKKGRPLAQDHMERMLRDVAQASRFSSSVAKEYTGITITGDEETLGNRVSKNVRGILPDGMVTVLLYKPLGRWFGEELVLAFQESATDWLGPELVIRSRGFDSCRGIRFFIPAKTDVHYENRDELYKMLDKQFIIPRMKHLLSFDVRDQAHREVVSAMADSASDTVYLSHSNFDVGRAQELAAPGRKEEIV